MISTLVITLTLCEEFLASVRFRLPVTNIRSSLIVAAVSGEPCASITLNSFTATSNGIFVTMLENILSSNEKSGEQANVTQNNYTCYQRATRRLEFFLHRMAKCLLRACPKTLKKPECHPQWALSEVEAPMGDASDFVRNRFFASRLIAELRRSV